MQMWECLTCGLVAMRVGPFRVHLQTVHHLADGASGTRTMHLLTKSIRWDVGGIQFVEYPPKASTSLVLAPQTRWKDTMTKRVLRIIRVDGALVWYADCYGTAQVPRIGSTGEMLAAISRRELVLVR